MTDCFFMVPYENDLLTVPYCALHQDWCGYAPSYICDDNFHLKKIAIHLAIMTPHYLDLVLTGKKTIESRFSEKKQIPYNRVEDGDLILFKKSGGDIKGIGWVKQVQYYYNLTPLFIEKLIAKFNDGLCIQPDFIQQKQKSQFATLIWLKNVKPIKPLKSPKKYYGTGWDILYDYHQQTLM